MYRAQFAYPTPDGFTDTDFEHYFDQTTVPALAPGVGAPDQIYNIPLPLDPDAPFYWRGLKIPNLNGVAGPLNIGLRFRSSPGGRQLSGAADAGNTTAANDFVPIWLLGLTPCNDDALTGGQCCVLESEIPCPAAGTVIVEQSSLTPGAGYQVGTVILAGVKRYANDACCGETCRA